MTAEIQHKASENNLVSITKELFPIFKEENYKKISEKEEEELLSQIIEKMPKDLIIESRIKDYMRRFREQKRPSFSFFEAILKIKQANEVFFF